MQLFCIDCFLDDKLDSELFLAFLLDSTIDKSKTTRSDLLFNGEVVEGKNLRLFGHARTHLYTLF
jgi:hypothetical protein